MSKSKIQPQRRSARIASQAVQTIDSQQSDPKTFVAQTSPKSSRSPSFRKSARIASQKSIEPIVLPDNRSRVTRQFSATKLTASHDKQKSVESGYSSSFSPQCSKKISKRRQTIAVPSNDPIIEGQLTIENHLRELLRHERQENILLTSEIHDLQVKHLDLEKNFMSSEIRIQSLIQECNQLNSENQKLQNAAKTYFDSHINNEHNY